MPLDRRRAHRLGPAVAALLALALAIPAARAQSRSVDELVSAVVQIKTFINPDGRTTSNLGHERSGTGVVIDDKGHVLTIGYLMVEAYAAEIILDDGRTVSAVVAGYDHDTGFGLLRAGTKLDVKPIALGRSADIKKDDRVMITGHGGVSRLAPATVVSRREFAGNWEYLIDSAIFTTPPYAEWSGAALLNRSGALVGIGSLVVREATDEGAKEALAGNMFVPIDLLPPILGDLIAKGHASRAARPWLGLNADVVDGKLRVSRVVPGGPAEFAGLGRGDVISGVDGREPKTLSEFYRMLWSKGEAGVVVPLDVIQDRDKRRLDLKSMNRLDHLRLKSTF